MIKISFLSAKFATLRLMCANNWYVEGKELNKAILMVVVLSECLTHPACSSILEEASDH